MKKEDQFIYIVTDGEFDGPIPGANSMLSFASVAVTAKGEQLGEFEATLLPLQGAQPAPETMAFWKTCPEAYKAATLNPRPVAEVMAAFVKWVTHGDALKQAGADFVFSDMRDLASLLL